MTVAVEGHVRVAHGNGVTARAVAVWQKLNAANLTDDTLSVYERCAEEVRRVTGGISSARFLDFLAVEIEKALPPPGEKRGREYRRAAVTMRGYK